MPVFVAVVTALMSCSPRPSGDIRQVSGDVAAASRALPWSVVRGALQAQQRGLNSMLLRNFMASEFDKGRPSSRRAPDLLAATGRTRTPEPFACSRTSRRDPRNSELNPALRSGAGRERRHPKYALMVDAAIRDADTRYAAFAETFGAINEGHPADGEWCFAGGGHEANVTVPGAGRGSIRY